MTARESRRRIREHARELRGSLTPSRREEIEDELAWMVLLAPSYASALEAGSLLMTGDQLDRSSRSASRS
ncbi:MAG TPA: hypothetical protein VGL84_03310 [Gaiellaceae bacterium]|jgi:hypothetical protein